MSKRTRCITVVTLLFLTVMALSEIAYSDEGHGHSPQPANEMDNFFENASLQNGWSIYHNGTTLTGRRIEIDGGPHWLYMHGGSCASCHGSKGQGGIIPMMCSEKTPPITLKDLLSGEHEHGATEEKHTPYTIKTIKRALEFSINPALKLLDPCMPKWFLNEDEYRDLLFYLKSLGE